MGHGFFAAADAGELLDAQYNGLCGVGLDHHVGDVHEYLLLFGQGLHQLLYGWDSIVKSNEASTCTSSIGDLSQTPSAPEDADALPFLRLDDT